MSKIKITQIKSTIGYKKKDKATLEALGIRKMHQSVVKDLNPAIEGMIKVVSHLIKTEKVEG
ncbi:MAG: 50S ribosomal protein L30 [Candidatus Marinimicrobia bacterium]|nr:50S ribosomal protein L30 [Candidatus Neomarinimicrobiota bacterium]